MAYLKDLRLRLANPSDAETIAALHADSWRRHYRGAYSDAFLDGDVISDRLAVWADQAHVNPVRGRIGLRATGSTRTTSSLACYGGPHRSKRL